jgi:hypothetical protein
MQLYEALYEAYKLLEDVKVDTVVPMDVYLDDKNVADGDTVTGSATKASMTITFGTPSTGATATLTVGDSPEDVIEFKSPAAANLTSGTITSGGNTVTVASTTGYAVDDLVYVRSAAGPANDTFARVTGVTATVLTLQKYLPATSTFSTISWASSQTDVVVELLVDESTGASGNLEVDPVYGATPAPAAEALTYALAHALNSVNPSANIEATQSGTGSTAVITVKWATAGTVGNGQTFTKGAGLEENDIMLNGTTSTTADLAGGTAAGGYPVEGAAGDGLGKLFTQEYNGRQYYWWDTDADGDAEIFPTVGSASATTDANGAALTSASFHEVNFAYQLANFCFSLSQNSSECFGMVGTRPPSSFSLEDISTWVGKLPTYTEDANGDLVVASAGNNGTGLLGNKWMAGKNNFRGGKKGGGFILTDTQWVDGTEQKDDNDHFIDIGKYISVVSAWPRMFNPSDRVGNGYVANASALYAGVVSALPANSAPTNKVVRDVRLQYRLNSTKLNQLIGTKYVLLNVKPKGIVVVDSPTAARSDSDYRRLSTVRIVKATIDAIRAVADPFIGESNTSTRREGLRTACERALDKLQKAAFLQRYEVQVSATPAQQILGETTVQVKLVPAFEMRQITVTIALAAE